MPKSRKRPAAKAKAARRRLPGPGTGGSPWPAVPRAAYGRERPAPPPGAEWPEFNDSPWFTWAVISALRDATPEERAELGLPPTGDAPGGLTPDIQLALIEIAPWRIAPGWAGEPLTDQRAEWTSLAAEATGAGKNVAGLAEELTDLEERGHLRWDQEHQAALLATDLGKTLGYLDGLP
jgi:hypothetical protein